MQNTNNYDYNISISDIENTIKNAINAGYTAYVIINGEYYSIIPDTEKEDIKQ